MEPVRVKNFADTYVNNDPGLGGKNYGVAARLWVRAGAGQQRYALLYFVRPWPDAVLSSARLKLYQGEDWAGGPHQVSVQREAAKWDVNKVTYNTTPGVTGPVASLSKTAPVAGTEWDIDVLPVLQPVVIGPWYGLRVSIDTNTARWFHSAQSSIGKYRPLLEVTWSEAPDEPDMLRPGGGRAVSLQYPYFTFDFNDTLGDTDLDQVAVEIGSTQALVDAGAAEWKSGLFATTAPELNSAALPAGVPAWGGIAADANLWWRTQAADGAGIVSVWSDAVPFTRKTKGVLTITTPAATPNNFIWSPSPLIAWTFTGRVQKHYQVSIADNTEKNKILWTSGKITSTATSVSVPFGIVKPGVTYLITVRIWDTENREMTPGDDVFVEATRTATINYDAAVAAPTVLQAVSDPINPVAHLTWDIGVQPNQWVIQRSADDGVTWEYIAELDGADPVSGTEYKWDDATAPQYVEMDWRVLAIVGDRQSANAPTAQASIRRLAPFLMRRDGTDVVCFLNPKRDRERLDVQELHKVMGGPPVLVTQRLGLQAGHVEGRLTSDPLPGVTAKQLLNRFRRLRDDSGIPMSLLVGDETLKVIAYNFQDDIIIDSGGITYFASFDWFEVPGT